MYDKMIETGQKIIREYYPKFEDGTAPRTSQNDDEATWWPRRRPEHGLINWNQSPRDVHNWIRGQTRPYPGAFSYIDGKKVIIWQADSPNTRRAFARPGEIMYRNDNALGVGVWESTVELTEIQVEDDDPIVGGELIDQYDIKLGDQFENVRNE
jgi:methionyl-tRNA formyltransferase